MSEWDGAKADKAQILIRQIVDLQRALFDIGLVETAHKVTQAEQAIGWEIAGKMKKALKDWRP